MGKGLRETVMGGKGRKEENYKGGEKLVVKMMKKIVRKVRTKTNSQKNQKGKAKLITKIMRRNLKKWKIKKLHLVIKAKRRKLEKQNQKGKFVRKIQEMARKFSQKIQNWEEK